jgi:myosin-crossreactive antigen
MRMPADLWCNARVRRLRATIRARLNIEPPFTRIASTITLETEINSNKHHLNSQNPIPISNKIDRQAHTAKTAQLREKKKPPPKHKKMAQNTKRWHSASQSQNNTFDTHLYKTIPNKDWIVSALETHDSQAALRAPW